MDKANKYQKAIYKDIRETNNNILINSGAGTGKTTTIVNSTRYLDEEIDVLFTAFNNHIVDELKGRVREGISVSTLHSFGWQALMRHYRGKNIRVEKEKVYNLVMETIHQWDIPAKQRQWYAFKIKSLVDLVRLDLSETDDEIADLADKHEITIVKNEIEHCRQTMGLLYENTNTFDFVDMIYLPATEKSIKVMKYDVVYIDECQDLSKVQQKLFLKAVKNNGRFIAVGDPNQAIYGFAGADVESYNNLKEIPRTIELPLSVCYRCAKSIVRLAQNIVPTLEIEKSKEMGVIRNGLKREIRQGDWVLCRNTKPLVKLCIELIKNKRKANIKGKDYGRELASLLRKAKSDNVKVAVIHLHSEIEKLYNKLKKLGVNDPANSPSMISLMEKVEIIEELILEEAKTVKAGIKLIESIFTESVKEITLSTIHKSKGFENERIFVLKRELIPSKYAISEWQLQQERNLEYVMITRAKKELIYIVDEK